MSPKTKRNSRPLSRIAVGWLLAAAVLLGASYVPADSGEISLTILNTTDIHGVVRPGTRGDASWLQMATIIRGETAAVGGSGKRLLIDCGDTYQGTFEESVFRGAMSIKIMNALEYDAWAIGNHEFDFGLAPLLANIDAFQGASLLANVRLESGSFRFAPWRMFTKKGLKIAVIGVVTPYLHSGLWGDAAAGVKVYDLSSTLAAYMPEVLAARPDMVILAAHHGEFPVPTENANSLFRLARDFPEIDLILGGHTHQLEPGKRFGQNAWYVQAGARTEAVAKITAVFDGKTRRLREISSRLIPVTADIPPCRKTASLLAADFAKFDKLAARKVGTAAHRVDFDGDSPYHSPMAELLASAMRAAVPELDAAFHGAINRFSRFEGDIDEAALFRVMPYENTIGVLKLTVAQLAAVVEEQLAAPEERRFQSPSGLFFEIDEDNARVLAVRDANGGIMRSDSVVSVGFNSFILAGRHNPLIGRLSGSPACAPRDTGILVRDAVRAYLKANSPVSIREVEWITRRPPE